MLELGCWYKVLFFILSEHKRNPALGQNSAIPVTPLFFFGRFSVQLPIATFTASVMEEESKRKAKKSKRDKKKKDKKGRRSREHSHKSNSLADQNALANDPAQHTVFANGHSLTEVSRDFVTSQPDHWHPALSKSKHKKIMNLLPKKGMDDYGLSSYGEIRCFICNLHI
jgi:hypothetical protein